MDMVKDLSDGVDYFVLTNESLPRLAILLNTRPKDLGEMLLEADVRNWDYVFFKQEGEWKKLVVDRRYPIKWVMTKVLS